MLENPIKREAAKAGAVGLATAAGGSVAIVLAASLGIAVEALGYLGEKRTLELFDSQELLDKVIAEIQRSDDFASFVYDVWLKHNFESSETRRKRLKKLLENATKKPEHDFENFTRVITAAQQISEWELKVLAAFYDDEAYKYSGQGPKDHIAYQLNVEQVNNLLKDRNMLKNDQNTRVILNQLCYFGLLGNYIATNGEYYIPVQLGRIFLDYIEE